MLSIPWHHIVFVLKHHLCQCRAIPTLIRTSWYCIFDTVLYDIIFDWIAGCAVRDSDWTVFGSRISQLMEGFTYI